MNSVWTLAQRAWGPFSWLLLGLAGVIGLVALVRPKTFERMVALGGRWLDSSRALAHLDKRVEVDRLVLPYSRILGAAVLAAVAILWLRFAAR